METSKTIIKYDSGKIKKVKIFKDDIDEKNYIKPLRVRIHKSSRILLEGSAKMFLLIPDYNSKMFYLKPIKDDNNISQKDFLLKTSTERPISRGSYGSVVLTPEDIIYKESLSEDLTRDMIMEVAIYNLLRNIGCLPELYGFDIADNFKFYMEKGIKTLNKFEGTAKERLKIIFRLCKCMRSISGQGVLHLDLKPQNIILDKENRVQIIDWGMAEIENKRRDFRKKDLNKQTRWYRSPEIIAEVPYGTKADTYSIGLILLEMLIGKPPLTGNTDVDQAYLVLVFSGYTTFTYKQYGEKAIYYENGNQLSYDKLLERYKNIFLTCNKPRKNFIKNNIQKYFNIHDPEILDFFAGMLEFKPEFRSSWNDIILHPIFQKMFREDVPRYNILINNMPIIEDINKVWEDKKISRINILTLIHDVSEKLRLVQQTEELCFQLLDLYVWKFDINPEKISLLASACLYLSIQIFDSQVNGDDIRTVLQKEFGHKPSKIYIEVVNVFTKLKGNIIIPTCTSYIYFSKSEYTNTFELYKSEDVYKIPMITRITGENWKNINYWSI